MVGGEGVPRKEAETKAKKEVVERGVWREVVERGGGDRWWRQWVGSEVWKSKWIEEMRTQASTSDGVQQMSKRLTVRDVEILRTLLRLQVATTAQLQRAFFTQARLARRRLQVLRERGYIAVHGRGARGPYAEHGGTWWRLTADGVQMVACTYPSEPMPDNAVHRAARASLRNFEHREAIGDLYFGLITDRHKEPAEIAARASALMWHGEYDVALSYEAVDAAELVERQVIPDATIATAACRYFIEIDRSTESRARCERAVVAYDRHVVQGRYAAQFPDGRPPHVVYVTRSRARAESLQRMLSRQQLQLEVTALPLPAAVTWLRQVLAAA